MTISTCTEQQTAFGWSVEAIRAAEQATGNLLTDGTLMQRAAHALAEFTQSVLQDAGADTSKLALSQIVVLAGPGNNGGDALYAAKELANAGFSVTIVRCTDRIHDEALAAARQAGVEILEMAESRVAERLLLADVIIDGILGIGARSDPLSPWRSLVDALPSETTIIAADCPTPGIRADLTLTFGAPKTSLLLNPATCGRVEVADIGLPVSVLGSPEAFVASPRALATTYPVPGRQAHKYTRGVVGFATGSDAYPGAAVLGTLGALGTGTGMVRYVGPDQPRAAVLAAAPEVVPGVGRVQAWVVGSGIDGPRERESDSERYRSAMRALRSDVPAVVDAGALTWLEPDVRPDGTATIITPHAGELASLFQARGIDVQRQVIEADPLTWARRAGEETGYTVLLKGGVSVVCDPARPSVSIENRAPAWLATAGTGDVLAGVVGALLAGGLATQDAASLGAYLHGQEAREANPGGPVRAVTVAHQLPRKVASLLALR